MTNFIAVVMGVVLVTALGIDYAIFGSEHLLFLGKKFFVLLDWVAFWR
ncbi:hypothetical protein ACOXXX_00710 [Thalassococcus sp. BH17M4-6]